MLSRFIQVRSGEGRGVVGAFLLLFGILASHTLLETARDALFLSSLPAERLPWVYLAIAVTALVVAKLRLPRSTRLTPRLALAAWLALAALATLGFWGLTGSGAIWSLYALYVWSGLYASLSVLYFWLLLGDIYTATQAKRLYGPIGAGAVLGGLAGAGVARAVAGSLATAALLVTASILMLASATVVLVLVRDRRAAADGPASRRDLPEEVGRGLRRVMRHPYLRRVAALVVLTTAVFTLVDYIFKAEVAKEVAPGELGTFFATFYLALNGAALVVQLGLVSWVLKVLGVHRALWILPLLLVAGSSSVVLGGGLLAVLLMKGADGALRHSLYRTSIELLYVPVADKLRAQVKPVIDVLGHRGGQAVSSLGILAAVAIGVSTPLLALGVILLALLWILLSADMRGYYLDLFRDTLKEGAVETRVGLQSLDLSALETLFQALNSSDDEEVLGALDLLAQQDRVNLVPALILYHPSRRVVLAALDAFVEAERRDVLPMSERLLEHSDPEVRAAVLRARAHLAPDELELRGALEDDAPVVRATALISLRSGEWATTDDVEQRLHTLLQDPRPEQALALARAFRRQPSKDYVEPLLELVASSHDATVRTALAEAMGEIADPAFIDPLIAMLGSRETREASREALVRIGEPALKTLHLVLHDGSAERHLRRHLPRTISRFASQEAASILLNHLLHDDDSVVRYKILRGLGRMRADHPELEMDQHLLERGLEMHLTSAFRMLDWHTQLDRAGQEDESRKTAGHRLLVDLLRDKHRQAIERTFRMIGLCFPDENVEQIYRGLFGDDLVQSSARELLDHLLEPPLRGAVLELVDEGVSVEQKLAAARPLYVSEPLSYELLLGRMLESRAEGVRSLAAHQAAHLGLVELREPIERLIDDDRLLEGVADRIIALFDNPPPPELAHVS